MKTMKKLYLVCIFLLTSCSSKLEVTFEQIRDSVAKAPEEAISSSFIWVGLEDSNISNPNNWQNKELPSSDSIVEISSECVNCDIVLDDDVTFKSLTFQDDFSGTINLNGKNLIINDDLKTSSGTVIKGKCSNLSYNSHSRALGTMDYGEVIPDVSIADASTSEGGNLVFTFTLSESTCGKDVVLNISLNDQTATLADSDYSALSSSVVTIPSGSTSFDLMIPSTDDLIVESDETVELVIDSADGANILTSTATGTIINDDTIVLPVITPSIAGPVVEGSDAVITLTLDMASASDITFDWALDPQTVTIPSDLPMQSGSSVTIPAGQTTTSISVNTINDNPIADSGETFGLSFSNVVGATIDTSPFSVTLTDGGAVALSAEPSTKTIRIGESWKVSGAGGSAPYSYALISGAGSVDANGVYTAPQTPTTAVIEITDNVGATVQSTITVNQNYTDVGACNGFGFYSSDLGNIKDPGGDSNYAASTSCTVYIYSSSGQNIDLNFNSLSLGAGDTLTIRPSGGAAINYDENSTLPTGTVQTGASYIVLEFNSDASGESTGFDIDWEADYLALQLSSFSPSQTIEAGGWNYSLSIRGGTGPYLAEVVSGSGSIEIGPQNANQVSFTTSFVAENVSIRVTDSVGATVDYSFDVSITPFDVTSVSKSSGSPGETIYVYGEGFLPNSTVSFDSTPCDNIVVSNSTRITCQIPIGTGQVDISASVNHTLKTATDTLTDAFTYNPGSWNTFANQPPTSTNRMAAVSAWTGEKFIIWGGGDGSGGWGPGKYNSGFIYDKLTDSWSILAAGPVTRNKYNATYVWTGHELITSYGLDQSNEARTTGQAYNPSTNTWRQIANAPGGFLHDRRAVWTGEEMVLVGGVWNNVSSSVQAYNPMTNTWRALASLPDRRYRHDIAFTGRHIIVHGGHRAKSSGSTTDGFKYDLFNNTWSTIATSPVRSTYTHDNQQTNTEMMWSGDRLIFTGAWGSGSGDRSGIYNPYNNSWETMAQPSFFPAGQAKLIHTGTHVIYHLGNSNYAYNVLDDSWIRVANPSTSNSGSPVFEYNGNSAYQCFGTNKSSNYCEELDLTAFENPITNQTPNSFATLSTTSEPSARSGHTLTWNGKEVLVFGGNDGSGVVNTGHKYNPFSETWSAMSLTNAPSAREDHKALWIGESLFVFGGRNAIGTPLGDGAIYSSALDTWTTLPTLNAPSARTDFAIAKSHKYVLIWGGKDATGTDLSDGALYDIQANTWTSVSTTSAPSSGEGVKAVNIGLNRIAVFGGNTNVGGILDTSTNSWTTMSTVGAPSARKDHLLAYAKGKVLVYGGDDGNVVSDFKSYDVASDTWTNHVNSLDARKNHTYQVTDNKLLIFGGVDNSSNYVKNFVEVSLHDFTATSISTDNSISGGIRESAWIGSIGHHAFGYRNNHSGDSYGLILWGGSSDGSNQLSNGVIYKPDSY